MLVQEALEAGRYEVNFEANEIPTGLYVYRLTAGSTVLSKTMMLTK